MTNQPSASGDACSTKQSCCAWKFAAALLLLRLCLGSHFFSEGTSKLAYDEVTDSWALSKEFTQKTEIVFRNATGPFASFYKNQLPGFYDWENLLAVPHRSQPLSQEELDRRAAWHLEYASRQEQAEEAGEPLPIEFPEYAPYKAWGDEIVGGLREKLKKFTELSAISDEQDAEAAKLFVARQQQLVDFLAEEEEAITEYQHELWRLQEMEAAGGADVIPFREKRVAAKRTETVGLGGRLVSETSGIERGFVTDLRSVLTEEQLQDSSLVDTVDSALINPKERRLQIMNIGVTCLIIGVGVCLLLGVLTRLACLGGIVFLVSVMVTQLPWVPGARADFFYYQLVEVAALLSLLVSSPWRLPGLDYLLRGLRGKSSGAKG